MALSEVIGFNPFSQTVFGARQTQLFDRPNHYSFGTKIQEFAVPVGEEVSVIYQHDLIKKMIFYKLNLIY